MAHFKLELLSWPLFQISRKLTPHEHVPYQQLLEKSLVRYVRILLVLVLVLTHLVPCYGASKGSADESCSNGHGPISRNLRTPAPAPSSHHSPGVASVSVR